MVVTVSTEDRRSIKALAVLATADRWQRGHLKADGRPFYAVPSQSQDGLYYLVDTRQCTCPDHSIRGVVCCHVIAVRLRVAMLAGKPRRVPLLSSRLAV